MPLMDPLNDKPSSALASEANGVLSESPLIDSSRSSPVVRKDVMKLCAGLQFVQTKRSLDKSTNLSSRVIGVRWLVVEVRQDGVLPRGEIESLEGHETVNGAFSTQPT